MILCLYDCDEETIVASFNNWPENHNNCKLLAASSVWRCCRIQSWSHTTQLFFYQHISITAWFNRIDCFKFINCIHILSNVLKVSQQWPCPRICLPVYVSTETRPLHEKSSCASFFAGLEISNQDLKLKSLFCPRQGFPWKVFFQSVADQQLTRRPQQLKEPAGDHKAAKIQDARVWGGAQNGGNWIISIGFA